MNTTTRKAYRAITKGLGKLWSETLPNRGVRVEVTEHTDRNGRTVYAIKSDGSWGDSARECLGYEAKAWVFNDLLEVPDYQAYQSVCAPTPTWETVIRIASAKGCSVERADGKMVFVG